MAMAGQITTIITTIITAMVVMEIMVVVTPLRPILVHAVTVRVLTLVMLGSRTAKAAWLLRNRMCP